MRQPEKINFGRTRVNVIRDDGGETEKVCVEDICVLLRKPKLMTNGKVRTICQNSLEEIEGVLYASINDCKALARTVRQTKNQKDTIRRVIDLLNSLDNSPKPVDPLSDVVPVVYKDNLFKARRINGRLMFNVTEMAAAFGKIPSVWLNSAPTKRLMQKIVDDGKAPSTDCLYLSSKGRYGHTWLDSTLLVEYGRHLSPDFAIWCDEILVKLFSEGSVQLEDVSPDKMRNKPARYQGQKFLQPATYEEAVDLCQQQHEFIEESLPKIEYFDVQVRDAEWFPNTFISNELGITTRALNRFLEDEGVQVKKKSKWVLTEKYRGIPLKKDVPYSDIHAANPHNMRSVWTHYGREYIHELWKLRNG